MFGLGVGGESRHFEMRNSMSSRLTEEVWGGLHRTGDHASKPLTSFPHGI